MIEEVVNNIISGMQVDDLQDDYISFANTASEIAAENNINSEIEEKATRAFNVRDEEISEDIIINSAKDLINSVFDTDGEIAADVLNNILTNIETDENRINENLKDHVKNMIKKDNQQFLTATKTNEKNVLEDTETSSSANLPTLTDVISNEKTVIRRSKRLAEKDKKNHMIDKMDEQKQVKNLFKKLINDQNSVFYSSDKITRTLLNKGRKSSYEKDKVFYKIFNSIEDKDVIYDFNDENTRLPFCTPFVEQKKDIDRSSSLYSIDDPLKFFHADVAYLQFFSKSAVYPMRKKSNLAQKMELFSIEIEQKCNQKEKMRLQVDLEFQQNKIKKLNNKCNAEMFRTKTHEGKAFAAEPKIREFKKILFKSKRLHKSTKTSRLDSKKLIKNAVRNMNKTNSQKYDLPPETIEKKSLENENFREICNFHRMVKASKNAERYK